MPVLLSLRVCNCGAIVQTAAPPEGVLVVCSTCLTQVQGAEFMRLGPLDELVAELWALEP